MEGALLVLAMLACPVGMGLMMWFMARGQRQTPPRGEDATQTSARPASIEVLREEQQRLEADIARLEREQSGEGARS